MAVEVTDQRAIRYCFKVPRNGRLESVRFLIDGPGAAVAVDQTPYADSSVVSYRSR